MSNQEQQQKPPMGGGAVAGSFLPRTPAGPPPPYPQQQTHLEHHQQQPPYMQQHQQHRQQQSLQQPQTSYPPQQQQQQQQQQQYPPQQQQPPPLTVALPSPQQSQQHQPQQLTHAQLSPAVGADTEQPKPQQQPSKQQHVNLGFTPTPKLAQRHEKHQQQQQISPASPRPLYQFQVTKLRSWRTGYVRLLALYEQEFATLDPDTLQETNRWSYHSIHEWQAMPKEPESMLLAVENNTKLKFSCHYVHRAHVLTALLQCKDNAVTAAAAAVGQNIIPPPPQSHGSRKLTLTAKRYTRHGNSYSVQLHIKPYGLVETYGQQQHVLQTYKYTEMRALSLAEQHGVVLHFWQPNKSRLYLIPPDQNLAILSGRDGRTELVRSVHDFAIQLGLELPLEESRTTQQWLQQRCDFSVGAVATRWPVRKTTKRKDVAIVGPASGAVGGVVSRHLAITAAGYLVEQDGAGLVSCRKLKDLAALIRRQEEADQLTLEYVDGTRRTYASSSRDALCVSILDAAAKGQYKKVAAYVSDVPSDGYCLASLSRSPYIRAAISSEDGTSSSSLASSLFQPISIPVYILKRVYALATQTYAFVSSALDVLRSINGNRNEPTHPTTNIDLVEECYSLVEACRELNASVLPTGEGLPSGPFDKTISGCLGALWGLVTGLLKAPPTGEREGRREEAVSALLQTIYRLSRTLTGYKVSAELSTVQEAIPLLLQMIQDDFCRYWALQVIDILLSGFPGKREMEVEYVNKNVLLKCGGHALVEGIVSSLVQERPQKRVSELILVAASNVLQSVLCSFHDTTSGEHFGTIIRALADRYHGLLSALQSQSPCVLENTALLLHLLSTHAPSTATAIRDEALSSAILLQHFYLATFSPMEGQRFLSRYLCSLWFSGPKECDEKRLLRRMVPHGFLTYLGMPPLSRVEEEQLDELERDGIEENVPDSALRTFGGGASGTNTARLRSRIALAAATVEQKSSPENFRIFFHVLTQDHDLPDLIWSQQTRRELRIALESELAYVKREVEARGIDGIAWNHQQFQVHYPSLASEVKVGNVYMRLWLEAGDGFVRSWDEPLRLFEHLFRKFLCEIDRDEQVTNMVIRCMEKLYAVHAAKIGPFTDAMILVRKMSSTKSIETQHRLLRLLATILGVGKGINSATTVEIPENAEQLLNMESIGQLCQFVAWGHTDRRQMSNTLRQELGAGRFDDALCPPVWFFASTGKIPPPPEAIRGPFRVSELRRMMDEGDLSPYDLVTTAHVEEYDIDDIDPDTVKEDQIDTGKWKRLNEVWQLRWALCADASGASILGPSDVANLGLRSLTRLVDLHKSFDSRGIPYFPIPIAKRILCGMYMPVGADADVSPLAILSQAILCNNAELVDQAAEILFKVTRHNERATQKLYLTGVFFFACSYTGSNFKALARLIHATHLEQHFRSGFAAAANESELPMKDRSILGQILPEGLLFVLVNYGPEKFAEVFVGSADTPEVLWTADMRKHLIEMIHQHLGDFPLRLFQNNSTEYEYCPMPGVAYKRLEKEIFCHNYYINNLCDEIRFPDWPIAEPVEVFRACLEHFKKQLDEDDSTGEDALEEARLLLKLNEGDGSKELRKSYRRLARIFHPDKNPSGRDTFEAIQKSYELLMPLLEGGGKIRVYAASSPAEGVDSSTDDRAQFGGSHMQSAELLIRAQLLICRRYEREMSRYKYPAYSILLSCIGLPLTCADMVEKEDFQRIQQSAFVKSNIITFVRYAVELIFRTCLVSPLNAEELVGSGGIPILASLLSFYIAAIRGDICLESKGGDSSKHESGVAIRSILTFIVRTLAGVAFFENGRNAIKSLSACDRFILVLRACMDDSLHRSSGATNEDTQMKLSTLECFINLAKDTALQTQVIGSGVLWPLLKTLLSYDPTLETASAPSTDEGVGLGVSVASTNTIARFAVRVLGMLSGASQESPINEPFAIALSGLLTPPIATMLRNRRTDEILKVLNSNVESADIIWSSEMRKQLQNYVNKKEIDRPSNIVQTLEDALESVDSFAYDALEDELRIGGIYVRIFNKMGKDAFSRIPDPATFSDAIVNYIAHNLNASCLNDGRKIVLPDAMTPEVELREDRFLLATKSLLVLVQVGDVLDHALEESSTTIPSVLLSFLELSVDSEIFDTAAEILSIVSSRQAFAVAVARERVLWRLLRVLERVDGSENAEELSDGATTGRYVKRKLLSWSVLEALSSNPQVAVQIVSSSAWVELLGVLVGYSEFTKLMSARSGSAKTLSRLLWDPATGSRTVECLGRFLPPTLVVRLKDDPEAMLEVFDVESESPELIWNGSMRAELRKVLGKVLDDILAKGSVGDGKEKDFTLPSSVRASFPALEAELYIGGVYVSRFLKEPTYSLRDPTSFLEHLLQRWVKELETFTSGGNGVGPATNALAKAEQDILTSVTTAIVFVCKVRDTLCDKLAEWGYMSRALDLLEEVLDKELVGTPLLSLVRLLHVAAGRMPNVEALAVVGQGGRRGVVGFLLRSINSDPLHEDSAFMVEALKIIFETSLGDLKKIKQLKKAPQMEHQPGMVSVGPSPAPGEGPVRKRVEGMHPLGEPFGTTPQLQPSGGQSQTTIQQAVQQPIPGQPSSFVERQRHLMQSQQQSNTQALYGQFAPAPQQQTQTPLQQSVFGQQHAQFQNPPYGRQQPTFQQRNVTIPDGQQTYPSRFSSTIPSHSPAMPSLARSDDLSRQRQQLYQQPHFRQQQQQQYGANRAQTTSEIPHPALSQSQNIYGQNQQQQSSFGQRYQPSSNPQGVPTLQSQGSLPSSQPSVTVTHVSATQPSSSANPLTSHSQTMHNSSQGINSLEYHPVGPQQMPQPTQPVQQQQAQLQGHDPQQQGFYQPQPIGPGQLVQGPQPGSLYSQAPPPVSAPPQPPMEGTGIDARQTQEDPNAMAEQQAMTSEGAPGAARGRVALLQQALACDLCEFLVNNVLENPGLTGVRDPDGAKVHSIALLKLLTKDPGFGPKFKLVLSGIPAWAKYKSQDHSLLITGHEQKADYFLTDGSSGEKKLLTAD